MSQIKKNEQQQQPLQDKIDKLSTKHGNGYPKLSDSLNI